MKKNVSDAKKSINSVKSTKIKNKFISASQKKSIGRMTIRFRSMPIIISSVVLLIASVVGGFYILNKSDPSKAASINRSWSISGNQNGYGSELGWAFGKDDVDIRATNNVNENLKLLYPASSTSVQGRLACWRYTVPGNVNISQAKFNIIANSAGASQAVIATHTNEGYKELYINGSAMNGSETLVFNNLNLTPGSVIKVCNRVTEDGNPATVSTTFKSDRYVYVRDYAFFGTETVHVDDSYYYTPISSNNPPATMVVGQTYDAVVKVRNDGNVAWTGEGSSNPTRLATWDSKDRASIFYSQDGNWLSNNRIKMQESNVSPGDIATFVFRVTARTQGSYTENFNLVTEGIAWHPSRGIYFSVNVLAPSYSYSPVSSVNPPATMETGQRANVSVTVKNTGNYVWYGEGSPNPVRLATSSPNDRISGFAVNGEGWVNSNRIKLSNAPVYPGQNAVFNFSVETPPIYYEPTSVTERFNLIVEGKAWMPDRGIYFSTTGKPFLPEESYVSCATAKDPQYQEAENSSKSGLVGTVYDQYSSNCKNLGLYGKDSSVTSSYTSKDEGIYYDVYYRAKGRSYKNIQAKIKLIMSVYDSNGKKTYSDAVTEHTLTDSFVVRSIPSPSGASLLSHKGSKVTVKAVFLNDEASRDAFIDYIEFRPVSSNAWTANSTPRRTADSPDVTTKPSVHVIYAVPYKGVDRKLDTNGPIITSLRISQLVLSEQAKNKTVLFDTYQGKIDITYVPLYGDSANYKGKDSYAILTSEISLRFRDPKKTYLIFAEVDGRSNACGEATVPGRYAVVYLKPGDLEKCNTGHFSNGDIGYTYPDMTALHELAHNIGINHVKDDPGDLMHYKGGGFNIDKDRKNYYDTLLNGRFIN